MFTLCIGCGSVVEIMHKYIGNYASDCRCSNHKIRGLIDIKRDSIYFVLKNKVLIYTFASTFVQCREYDFFSWLSANMESELVLDSFDFSEAKLKVSKILGEHKWKLQ